MIVGTNTYLIILSVSDPFIFVLQKVWSVETGMPILTLKGHTSDVNCCTFSLTENGLVATCSSDATIKVFYLFFIAVQSTCFPSYFYP